MRNMLHPIRGCFSSMDIYPTHGWGALIRRATRPVSCEFANREELKLLQATAEMPSCGEGGMKFFPIAITKRQHVARRDYSP